MVTLLSLNEWKEQIISDIMEKWPFSSPRDLVIAIAEYIKSKMSYDAITPLFQAKRIQMLLNKKYTLKVPDNIINNIIVLLEWEWIDLNKKMKRKLRDANQRWEFSEELISLLVDHFRTKDKIWFDFYHLKIFKQILEEFKNKIDINDLPKNFQEYIKDISKFISDNDVIWLENYFYSQFWENKNFSNFIMMLFREMWYNDLMSIWNITSIQDMFNNVRIWVCRHYSIMMREIYNEILRKWEWINFSWESEILYVLNYQTSHAYNILIMDNQNWEPEKQYLDITSFIIWWWDLFKWKNDIKKIKWEMWVENSNSLDSYYL